MLCLFGKSHSATQSRLDRNVKLNFITLNMEGAIIDGGHNIFQDEDGNPIKFFIHKSIRPGARVKLTNDIEVCISTFTFSPMY